MKKDINLIENINQLRGSIGFLNTILCLKLYRAGLRGGLYILVVFLVIFYAIYLNDVFFLTVNNVFCNQPGNIVFQNSCLLF